MARRLAPRDRIGRHRHVCAFFNSQVDEYKVLIPFIENPYYVPPDEFLRELRLRSGPAVGP